MPRPRKCRRVCGMPQVRVFAPQGQAVQQASLVLTVDQYEMLRLMDLEGYTQEECARQMGVARTTVQADYNEARRILAQALVHGHSIRIEGGEYTLCTAHPCGGRRCGCCHKKKEDSQ